MPLTFFGFTLLAQDKSLSNLVSAEKSSAAISDDVTSASTKSSESESALITKAERLAIGRLKNVYKIDEGIYRSEQPDQNDFISLQETGLSEVLNLRRYWKDNKKARKTDLNLHHISMKAGDIKERDVIKALKLINDRKGPILIHCWHGSDRTGMLIAMYRVLFQNWTKENAIHEMTKGNFGFHSVYSNLIDFVRDADIDKIKEKVVGKREAEKMEEGVVLASELK
ncbi:tyrosine-protein phosphatase [Pedobacter sp. P351]|uniref:phosphatase domain-containing putative toxin n=1 Tax=Pedobacter superstes TaxID=3133441 RepID=UPI0030AD4323